MAKKRGAALDLEAFRKLDRSARELSPHNLKVSAQPGLSEEFARLKKDRQNADAPLIAEMKLGGPSASSNPIAHRHYW